jgi:hypothetical protein
MSTVGYKGNVVLCQGATFAPYIPAVESNFKILDQSLVDGEQWYTVSCLRETSKWLRETYQDSEDKLWFQNIDEKWHINFNVFDIHVNIYTLLALKWS